MTWIADVVVPKDTEPMAYTARHPRCGHVRVIQTDSRRESLAEFVALGLTGLTLARETVVAAKAGFAECYECAPPEQPEIGL